MKAQKVDVDGVLSGWEGVSNRVPRGSARGQKVLSTLETDLRYDVKRVLIESAEVTLSGIVALWRGRTLNDLHTQ